MEAMGAPNLTLPGGYIYGTSLAQLQQTIRHGRQGQMPAQEVLQGNDKVHLLAAYVYSLSHNADVSATPARVNAAHLNCRTLWRAVACSLLATSVAPFRASLSPPAVRSHPSPKHNCSRSSPFGSTLAAQRTASSMPSRQRLSLRPPRENFLSTRSAFDF